MDASNMALPFKEALSRLENRRVKATRPLIPPQILQEDLPLYVVLFVEEQLPLNIFSLNIAHSSLLRPS